MTQEISDLVLRDNYDQALTMATSVNHSPKLMGLYHTYLKELETLGIVDRVIEFLPDEKALLERKAAGLGLTSPELAILLAYTKIHIKNEILASDLPNEPYLREYLEMAFPKKLCKLYPKQLSEHPLRREIIATQVGSQIVNLMGITFIYRIQMETGASVSDIIRAQLIASRIFETQKLQMLVASPETNIPAKVQFELLHYIRNLTNLATRWFLRGTRLQSNAEKIILHYAERVKKLEVLIPPLMSGITKAFLESFHDQYIGANIPKDLMRRIAVSRAIYTALNIIEVSTQYNFDLIKTAKVYFEVGNRFSLVWFRDQIASDHREGHWNTLARLTIRDELDILQKQLTIVIMQSNTQESKISTLISQWIQKNQHAVDRWAKLLELLYAEPAVEYAMFFIAIRELSNWVNTKK